MDRDGKLSAAFRQVLMDAGSLVASIAELERAPQVLLAQMALANDASITAKFLRNDPAG